MNEFIFLHDAEKLDWNCDWKKAYLFEEIFTHHRTILLKIRKHSNYVLQLRGDLFLWLKLRLIFWSINNEVIISFLERPSVKTCGRSKGPMLSCSFIVFLILCFSSNNPVILT